MSHATRAETLIEEYLQGLDAALASAPYDVRNEFISSIKSHIEEGMTTLRSDDIGGVETLLQKIGDPKELAAEVMGPPHRTWDTWGRPSLIASLSVLLIAILAVGLVLRATYQPQITSSSSYVRVLNASGKVVPAILNGKSINSPEPQVWLEPKGTFTVEVIAVLQNEGDVGVTLDSVQTPNVSTPILPYRVFFSGGGNNDWSSFGTFHLVSIPGHGSVNIGIRYSEKCVPGSSNSYVPVDELPITFSFLGLHHSELASVQPYHLQLRGSC